MTRDDDLALRLATEAQRGVPHATIDVDAAVRESRARRRPAIIGTGVLAAVLVVGIGTLGVASVGELTPGEFSAADDASESSAEGDATAAGSPSPEALASDAAAGAAPLSCGAPLLSPDDVSDVGLALTLDIAEDIDVDGPTVNGVVILTNTADTTLSGVVARGASVAVTQDGFAVGVDLVDIGANDGEGIRFALPAGASQEFPLEFRALPCTALDGSEALPTGAYRVSITLTATLDDTPDTVVSIISAPVALRLVHGQP